MQRLAQFDVSRGIRSDWLRHFLQILFGAGCALAMVGLRTVLDIWFPTSGPFAVVYPTVLLATLYGHWRAGLSAYLLSFLWAWYIVLPSHHSFAFVDPTDPARVAINAGAVMIVLVFAESFRTAVVTSLTERDKEIMRRRTLMEELEHRTKNNFALAVSLLELQKRNETDAGIAPVLDKAIARIHSFALAYANLAETNSENQLVAMGPYLEDVADHVASSAFHEGIALSIDVSPIELPRETAVALGLFTNEALTNCAKYAFPDGETGHIWVSLHGQPEDWRLEVRDDGIGILASGSRPQGSGIGSRLFEAFASQAGASYEHDPDEDGWRVCLRKRR